MYRLSFNRREGSRDTRYAWPSPSPPLSPSTADGYIIQLLDETTADKRPQASEAAARVRFRFRFRFPFCSFLFVNSRSVNDQSATTIFINYKTYLHTCCVHFQLNKYENINNTIIALFLYNVMYQISKNTVQCHII